MSAHTQNDSASYLLAVERQNEERRVRIAELTAEVAELTARCVSRRAVSERLAAALDEIADHCITSKEPTGDDAVRFIHIARNALSEW